MALKVDEKRRVEVAALIMSERGDFDIRSPASRLTPKHKAAMIITQEKVPCIFYDTEYKQGFTIGIWL